jgi:3-hydroxybutyryl-CoA dehydrogenase
MTNTHSVAIIGAGLMGTGLARLFSGAGWAVAVCDPDEKARQHLLAALDEATASGRKPVAVFSELRAAVDGAELVIEAASEQVALKQSLFATLADFTHRDTLLATNSSVIPVGVVAARVGEADAGRVLGMHFWNPPEVIPLVEVIQGPRTSPESIARAMSYLRVVGKDPVQVRRDVVPGNRLQHALWREAMALVDEGVCTPQEIDTIVKRSFGLRLPVLGPLENADLVGLGLTRDIHRVVLPSLSRATEPSPGLEERLLRGASGANAGAGFYEGWSEARIAELKRRLALFVQELLSRVPAAGDDSRSGI